MEIQEKIRREKISKSLIGNKRAVGKNIERMRTNNPMFNAELRKKASDRMKKAVHFKGKDSNYWKGGTSQGYYLRLAKENLIQKCQICGNEKVKLLVHHKDKNRKNNVLSNLMIVCRSCHNKIHRINPQ
jgi:uncharacterized protein with FMN-binding domain